jgi:hypothetical protein
MILSSSNIHICVCVCVYTRFWFVAVWNEAESQDCSNLEGLTDCLSHYKDLSYKNFIHVAFTKEEMELRCR